MEYSFYDFLKLIGSLGMFLYGMKVMSEGLQKVAGDRLRSILTAMTTNRVTGILTGVLITALIQSSSATTVMVVSFVNAGLLSLAQSITVIMGANVGTTVTAWIISIFGFKVSISSFAIPLIGLSIPLIFSGNSRRRSWGEFIVGFAFLFLGLDFLKGSVPDIQSNPAILSFLTEYTNLGYLSIFLFLLIGTVLTIVVQSSSATMAITLIMCSKGWISFDIAAAMVLGENIGTTITANMAALSANISAKRAAFAHFLFNILGVCWVLLLFYPFTRMIATLVTEFSSFGSPYELAQFIKNTDPAIINQISEMQEKPTDPALAAISSQYQSLQVSVSYALSLFHSVFNIINVLIMGWFVNAYVFIVTRVIKQKKNDDEEFQLKYISGGMLSTSELSLLQVKKEIQVYAERTHRMFGMVRDLLHTKEGSEEYSKLYSRIEKYEQISDRMELEIANYLNKVADGRLSYEGKLQVTAMLTMVTEIESMGDSCYHLARTLIRKQEAKTQFTDEIVSNIDTIFKLVDDAINNMMQILPQNELEESDLNRTYNKETEINNFRNVLRITNIENVNAKKYEYQAGTFYMDLVEEAEKLADYIVNVVEALKEKRKVSK
ncbi:MAG TPA: Na/Pi cotransporter family protein [Candidatus Gallibacteroides avistercoris]|uniref:Na/Pi cotransporter family protein n=1 Tax=Candidatus Gallibacteroides avistercoris TaxID=2840833 RepID=A0A9D1M7X3_9BACT|nr:Na/Pi cotransporter family protein [Candidatus Gallibacteroides avistercoris]